MFDKERKDKAILLRKEGKSYSEILQIVPVAKSTLSFWLRDVGLSSPQKQKITEKRLRAAFRGAQSRRTQRESSTKAITDSAIKEVGKITERELFLIGTALYWAEGSKQKEHYVSVPVVFSNSDPAMVVVFLKWLKLLKIDQERIHFELYVHESARERVPEMQHFWSKILKSSINNLTHVYFKKGNNSTNRRNIGREYHGLIRIKVKESTDLNRQVSGWVSGICEN
jgi:hypothetical protein